MMAEYWENIKIALHNFALIARCRLNIAVFLK